MASRLFKIILRVYASRSNWGVLGGIREKPIFNKIISEQVDINFIKKSCVVFVYSDGYSCFSRVFR